MVRHDISSLPQKIKDQGNLSAQSAYIMKLTITTDIYKASTDPGYDFLGGRLTRPNAAAILGMGTQYQY